MSTCQRYVLDPLVVGWACREDDGVGDRFLKIRVANTLIQSLHDKYNKWGKEGY